MLIRSLMSLPPSHKVFDILTAASVTEDVLSVPLYFPQHPETISALEVALIDSRQTHPIRIRYDFIRDGWIIEQKLEDWKESAFLPAPEPEIPQVESRWDLLDYEDVLHEEVVTPKEIEWKV